MKIWVGLSIGSGAMLNEGIENLTDLVKVGIVFLSVKYRRDRLGAILIAGTMVITGISLGMEGINSLFAGGAITVTVEAFYVSSVSFALNYMLVSLKTVVGRTSGNLALLSDAKDNENHIKIDWRG